MTGKIIVTFDEFAKRGERNKYGIVKAARCADGFTVSIQTSSTHYCTPRTDMPFDCYTAYELGFPSEADDLILKYAEDETKPTMTVYGYVPVEVVSALIDKHGGIVL